LSDDKSRSFRKVGVWLTIGKNLGAHWPQLKNYTRSLFLSDRETLMVLKEKQVGIARFGDGEAGYLSGYAFSHQKRDPALRKKLQAMLRDYASPGPYLIALPYDIFFNRYQERKTAPEFWNAAKYSLFPYIKKGGVYGSAFCFRLEIVVDEDKEDYAALLMSLFAGKDLILVAGTDPVPGLIAPRVIINAPANHAFDEYGSLRDRIEKSAAAFSQPLVLLSLGITATALAADLNHAGILAYDLGFCLTRHLKKWCLPHHGKR
jgi:hypothetical protein